MGTQVGPGSVYWPLMHIHSMGLFNTFTLCGSSLWSFQHIHSLVLSIHSLYGGPLNSLSDTFTLYGSYFTGLPFEYVAGGIFQMMNFIKVTKHKLVDSEHLTCIL